MILVNQGSQELVLLVFHGRGNYCLKRLLMLAYRLIILEQPRVLRAFCNVLLTSSCGAQPPRAGYFTWSFPTLPVIHQLLVLGGGIIQLRQ